VSWDLTGNGVMDRMVWSAWSILTILLVGAAVAPPWTHVRRAIGSTRTARISDRSIMTPPSRTAYPATPWPPPRTKAPLGDRVYHTAEGSSGIFKGRERLAST